MGTHDLVADASHQRILMVETYEACETETCRESLVSWG